LFFSSLGYSGAQFVCAPCHPKETTAYMASFMGRSLGVPESVPAGKVDDSASGSVIRVEWRNGQMLHSLSEDGLSAEYKIAYQIGAGKVGYSYAAAVGDALLQSPVSYFKKYGWDVSPGFAGKELLDFDRVLSGRCLFCHSDASESSAGRRLNAIGCERCHGDSSEHVRRPGRENIVNPGKLTIRARDSVCEQCHLEGVARILNPGKALYDFKPGMDLEATLAIYVAKQPIAGVRAVSQEEQLAASECSKRSGGRLWCGTCHNPHGAATKRSSEIKTVCVACHPGLPAAHTRAPECTSCHMPQRAPSDVAHAALTDHRILAKPGISSAATLAGGQHIEAWRTPPADFAQRDLGLGYVEAGSNSGEQELSEAGGTILESLPASQRNTDAVVSAALGDINLSRGRAVEAAELFRRASELDTTSGRFAMRLGVSLEQSGSSDGAIKELRRAIQLDRSLERAYLELSALYQKTARPREAKEVMAEYLRWNPQSILGRLTERTLTDSKK
jgi:predicted CXXCH cytochrome family protein